MNLNRLSHLKNIEFTVDDGVAESGDDFTRFSTIFNGFKP
ncbi:hypothetical protein RintRC_2825 [Richelia intracellularis]|nr:hypothetical protein RintRC_2825 [Richelia intracellularis]